MLCTECLTKEFCHPDSHSPSHKRRACPTQSHCGALQSGWGVLASTFLAGTPTWVPSTKRCLWHRPCWCADATDLDMKQLAHPHMRPMCIEDECLAESVPTKGLVWIPLPSGKLTCCHGKSPSFLGNTIKIVDFHSDTLVYRSVT